MSNIQVSEVTVIPVKPKKGLLGFCTFVLNDAFFIRDVAIYNTLSNEYGIRLVYPGRRSSSGDILNTVHPINRSADEAVLKEVAKEFERVITKIKRSETENFEGVLSNEEKEKRD
ncbi:hypothetical protein ES703_23499 [subsurface metagenome]